MPEWLSTDNIAVIVLAIGNLAQWKQAATVRKELSDSRAGEKAALIEGMNLQRDQAAETSSISEVMSAVQRAIAKVADHQQENHAALQALTGIVKHHTRALQAIYVQTRQHVPTSPDNADPR